MQRKQRRILVVDDDAVLAAQLADLFRIEGYDVAVAPGGIDALRALEAGIEPDVVLLDLHMEGVNGWELHAELRQLGLVFPIVIVTADPDRERYAYQIGAAAALPKPLDFHELIRVVRRAVDRDVSRRLTA